MSLSQLWLLEGCWVARGSGGRRSRSLMSRAGASCPEQLHSFSLWDLSPVTRCDDGAVAAPGVTVTCSSTVPGAGWSSPFPVDYTGQGASLQGGCALHWDGARAGACCPLHSLSPEGAQTMGAFRLWAWGTPFPSLRMIFSLFGWVA